jgi:putative ABC transport system permease protein
MIAFNTSSISMDERAREHATMFAFGISPRRVLGIAITESAVIGIIATLLGLLGGYALLRYVLDFTASDVSPDIQILPVLSPSTVGVALALGVLAVAAAPLLNFRRLRRMNIPSTLRVME